jgi:hypothetical protein
VLPTHSLEISATALAVAEQRVGGGIKLGQRHLQGGVAGAPGVAGELAGRVPVTDLALGERRIAQLERLADLLRSEQADALFGRLLDPVQGVA